MLESSLAPYLLWAKTRHPAPIDLAGSNLLHCALGDLPGAREAVDLSAPNDNGFAPVREAIASHYGVGVECVVQANGCSGANFLAIAALVAPGDDVLVERPAYDPLIGAARLMGANVIRFDRRAEDGFRLDLDAVRGVLTPRTRLIVVTTPHNPSGVQISALDLARLAELAVSSGAHLLVDEVYLDAACLAAGEAAASRSAARLVAEGTGAAGARPARAAAPVIVTSSLTKSYGLAGLRAGWAIAPAAVAERLRRTRDVVDNAGTAPADRLAALAWTLLPRLAARTRELLGGNLARARAFFAAHPMLDLPEPPSCSVVFPRLVGQASAEMFVQDMLERHGVALAPGRFFDAPAHFRLSLAGDPSRLEAGLAILGTGLFSTVSA
jgi:aspartate/methionine/tyrosine aminotransferase